MIEPAKTGKKEAATSSLVMDDEEEDEEVEGEEEEKEEGEGSKEEGIPPTVEQVSSIQESILSHTASMVMGPNGRLDEKDKKVNMVYICLLSCT